jgi:hypothetical protein
VRLKDDDYSASYIDQVIDTARYMITKALDNYLIGGDCLRPFPKVKSVLKRGANARQRVLTPANTGDCMTPARSICAASYRLGSGAA